MYKRKNSMIKKSFLAIIAGGILSAAIGVIALVLLHGFGYPYTVYVTVLMACIALAIFLFTSAFLTGLVYKKVHESSNPLSKKALKWSYLLSLSLAVLIVAPLAVILPAAQGISYAVYLPVFLLLLIPAAMLLVVSVPVWFVLYGQIKKECRRPLF